MTDAEHVRWCIRRCPCFAAERTVHWFLYGYDPMKSNKWLGEHTK